MSWNYSPRRIYDRNFRKKAQFRNKNWLIDIRVQREYNNRNFSVEAKGKTLFHTHDIIGTPNVPLDLHRGVSSRILARDDSNVSWISFERLLRLFTYRFIHQGELWSYSNCFCWAYVDNFTRSTLIILLDARIESLGRNVCSLERYWSSFLREWNATPYTMCVRKCEFEQ